MRFTGQPRSNASDTEQVAPADHPGARVQGDGNIFLRPAASRAQSFGTMAISLHDNWIYAHWVDHDSRTIVLHTIYPHIEPPEFTDVVFEDVVVHHFETQCMTTRPPYPANVLFDIEEEDAESTLGLYAEFITSKRNYGWPANQWSDLKDLARILTGNGHRCFHIHGTVGLDGFVFARKMMITPRSGRWTNQAEQNTPPNALGR